MACAAPARSPAGKDRLFSDSTRCKIKRTCSERTSASHHAMRHHKLRGAQREPAVDSQDSYVLRGLSIMDMVYLCACRRLWNVACCRHARSYIGPSQQQEAHQITTICKAYEISAQQASEQRGPGRLLPSKSKLIAAGQGRQGRASRLRGFPSSGESQAYSTARKGQLESMLVTLFFALIGEDYVYEAVSLPADTPARAGGGRQVLQRRVCP